MSRFKRSILIIFTAVLALGVASVFYLQNKNMIIDPQQQKEEVKNVLEELSIVLPTEAEIGGFKQENGMDGAYFLKITLPKNKVKDFIATTPFKDELFSEEKRYMLGTNNRWWNPESPKTLPTAQKKLPSGHIMNVGIDESDTSTTTLYIMWFWT